jgi:hypothetical protein
MTSCTVADKGPLVSIDSNPSSSLTVSKEMTDLSSALLSFYNMKHGTNLKLPNVKLLDEKSSLSSKIEVVNSKYTKCVEAQKRAGKSEDYALVYAASHACCAQPEDIASKYAECVEVQRKAGKSGDYALAYAGSCIYHAKTQDVASKYAECVELQRKAGKSEGYSLTYAANLVYYSYTHETALSLAEAEEV